MIRNTNKEIAATSKHRASPCYEWSKQVSRDVHPYFVPQPVDNQKGSYNAERPQRHHPVIDLDRSIGRHDGATKLDERSYEPKLYEELHPHCSVNIGKSTRGKDIFAAPPQPATALTVYPPDEGWGRGKKSWMPKAPKPKDAVDKLREEAERYQREHDAAPPPAHDSSIFVESRIRRPPGGAIPKADARKMQPAPDRPALEVHLEAVLRHSSVVDIRRAAARDHGEKTSDKYRALFRTPPPPPLYSADRPRITKGFAPSRSTSSMSVQDLLANADADIKRARSVLDGTFGTRSRSELRSTMLYTPQPGANASDGRRSESSLL